MATPPPRQPPVPTGIEGLDAVLNGGLPAYRMYLLHGEPGVGKTTMALQFLLEGVRLGEACLYVTVLESEEEIQAMVTSHGWSLDGVTVYSMLPGSAGTSEEDNTLYLPAEVELGERMAVLLAEIDRVKPQRLVVDSISEIRLLAGSALRFRRQLMALKRNILFHGCTILLLENAPIKDGDALLQSLVHGVIQLEQLAPLYGAERRRLRVLKMRERRFRGGYHDFTIVRGGVRIFPRLVAAEHHLEFQPQVLSSDLPALDAMLGGGLDHGTCALFLGPAGTGKSALANQYAHAAASRGDAVALFTFDEGTSTFFGRGKALGIDLQPYVETGRVSVQQIDPAELSPGEFCSRVREAVEERGARVVVIDSLNGYLNAMPEETFLLLQLHELLSYLRQRGVVIIVIVAQHGVIGSAIAAPLDISYLADTVVLFRYFDSSGRARKAISILKKRSGTHEDVIRSYSVGAGGLAVGEVLENLHGILTGVPFQVHGVVDESGGTKP